MDKNIDWSKAAWFNLYSYIPKNGGAKAEQRIPTTTHVFTRA